VLFENKPKLLSVRRIDEPECKPCMPMKINKSFLFLLLKKRTPFFLSQRPGAARRPEPPIRGKVPVRWRAERAMRKRHEMSRYLWGKGGAGFCSMA
jgi:hypothetical protein